MAMPTTLPTDLGAPTPAPTPAPAEQPVDRTADALAYIAAASAAANVSAAPTEQQPPAQQSAWGQPQQPPAQQPAWGQPQQPAWGQPQQPAWGQPQQPAWGQPQQPAWGQPQQPAWGQPQQPAWGQPQQPAWGQPQQPAWGQPQQPAWGQPQQPAWGQPQQPAWGQPQQPAWGQSQLPPQPKPLFDISGQVDFGLTEEERAAYSKAVGVIDKVVRARLGQAEGSLRGVIAGVQGTQAELAAATEAAFSATVESAIPALPQYRNDPQWSSYLNSQVPYTGQTVQALLSSAYQRRDVAALTDIVNGFAAGRQQQPPAPQPPAPQPPAQPQRAGNPGAWNAPQTVPVASGPTATAGQPQQTFPLSAHTRASRDYVRGAITRDVWMAIDSQYKTAIAENRVDMSR